MTDRQVFTDLKAARALITDPACWIQGNYHAVIGGRDCYCLDGALQEATGGGLDRWFEAREALMPETDYDGPINFNDCCHSHAEVLAALDQTITRLEQETR